MARYIERTCPRCHEYFCVSIKHPSPKSRELPISAWCAVCSYSLDGWRLIVRRKPPPEVRYGRMWKVFRS